ncbi:hypothetical protein KTJ32_06995 [Acinetobacter gyllenbergii]|uniref:hypothetical protein n=1 Tax=Acinetobacter gyllenbergii TaxID=134534 RepID=UPI0021CFFD76|nr:hypothetical protein [Acinetobacter gyllenbergii]MCU4580737.1 hypothetical protein [Acinetobacter gyllenbergii]
MIALIILILVISFVIGILIFSFQSVALKRKLKLIFLTFIGLTLLLGSITIGLDIYYGNQVPEGTIPYTPEQLKDLANTE